MRQVRVSKITDLKRAHDSATVLLMSVSTTGWLVTSQFTVWHSRDFWTNEIVYEYCAMGHGAWGEEGIRNCNCV